MLSWDTRIERLTRAAAMLRGQLPFIEPGRSARAQMRELLDFVEGARVEVQRRLAMKRRADLREMVSRVPPALPSRPRIVARPAASDRRASTPASASYTLPLPPSANARWSDDRFEYEVVWPRAVAS